MRLRCLKFQLMKILQDAWFLNGHLPSLVELILLSQCFFNITMTCLCMCSYFFHLFILAGASFVIPLEPTDSSGKMVNLQQFKDVRDVMHDMHVHLIVCITSG